jgi:hypothetical protein
VRKRALGAAAAGLLTFIVAGAAHALPAATPDNTGMVDLAGAGGGANAVAVRTIAQAGSNIWVGGKFTEIDDASGNKIQNANGLAVFDEVSGSLQGGVHIPNVTKSGGDAEVYDASLGPDGNLYVAGDFDQVDGQTRGGVAAIDALTGQVVAGFHPNVGNARSVLATASAIYVGGTKLFSFQPNGGSSPGFRPPLAIVDPTIRAHATSPLFSDIAIHGSTLVAACHCDRLSDSAGTRDVKAVVELDALDGSWVNWAPGGLTASSGAFGISLLVHDAPSTGSPTVYLAAGGSDFTAAYDFDSGVQRFNEDTSGSSQAIAWYQGDLIVGGHFDWSQKAGSTQKCGDNQNPNSTGCWHSPKLIALSAISGDPRLDAGGRPWNPGICCQYNGVWVLLVDNDGSTLHVGGEFTRAGGSWTGSGTNWTLSGASVQQYYARFSGGASTSERLTIQKAGTSGATGTVTSAPAGINCGPVCSSAAFDFPAGRDVTLTATPSSGSTFVGWSGSGAGFSCPGTGTCTVTMDTARTVTAAFGLARTTTFPLTVTKSGHAAGTATVESKPRGIDCGTTCTAPFPTKAVVTLTVTPGSHSTFVGWSGAGCSGRGTCVVTMTSAKSVNAEFAKGHG